MEIHMTDLEKLVADLKKRTDALRTIQQWDCLNPPNPELLMDLPWLKRLVDEALS
jgi:hypothetical protein